MQAFSGIRVLDFTHVYAGPFATFQLAVMGAEVIKIEPPHSPDLMRSEGVDEIANQQGLGTSYTFNNQGKKAISIDLNSDQGKDITRRLIKSADVLVENYSDGLGQYGFDSQQALKINPQLIYCDMSGFGPDNVYAGRPAYDQVIQAFSGMMSLNGEAGQSYLRVGPPLVDYGTGAQAAFAIASALFQRSRSGKGQVITVNMLDAALMMMSPLVADTLHSGETALRHGNINPSRPGYSVFRCKDDNLMVGAYTLNQHINLFTALDLGDLITVPQGIDEAWIRDNAQILRDAMLKRFAEKTADSWEQLLNAVDVPAARVRALHEMLENDQPSRSAASQVQRIPGSSKTAPIAAFSYAENGPVLNNHCSRHGEDTAAVLAELGYDAGEIESFRANSVI